MIRLRKAVKRGSKRPATADSENEEAQMTRQKNIKRQSMTNIAVELGATVFIAYLVIELNGIYQVCDDDLHRHCLDYYLLNGGQAHEEFILMECINLKLSCERSGLMTSGLEQALRYDPTNASIAGIDEVIYDAYLNQIQFCFCLTHSITFNETGSLLTVGDSKHDNAECEFDVSRALFFIFGVILVALMEGSASGAEKSIHKWENWLEFFGRIIALLGSFGYFFAAVLAYQKSINTSIECDADKFKEVANVCTVIGLISLVALVFFMVVFEIAALYTEFLAVLHEKERRKSSILSGGSRVHPFPFPPVENTQNNSPDDGNDDIDEEEKQPPVDETPAGFSDNPNESLHAVSEKEVEQAKDHGYVETDLGHGSE